MPECRRRLHSAEGQNAKDDWCRLKTEVPKTIDVDWRWRVEDDWCQLAEGQSADYDWAYFSTYCSAQDVEVPGKCDSLAVVILLDHPLLLNTMLLAEYQNAGDDCCWTKAKLPKTVAVVFEGQSSIILFSPLSKTCSSTLRRMSWCRFGLAFSTGTSMRFHPYALDPNTGHVNPCAILIAYCCQVHLSLRDQEGNTGNKSGLSLGMWNFCPPCRQRC